VLKRDWIKLGDRFNVGIIRVKDKVKGRSKVSSMKLRELKILSCDKESLATK
jgi:hypothetical protein